MLRFSIEGGSGGTPAADSGGTGMLGLDMALHHYHHQQQQQDQLLPSHAKSHDADHHRPQISYAYGGSGRGKQLSPEEEPRFGEEGIGAAADGSKPASPSPWHRMKWTDSMVRLLIMVVYCIGDDGTTEGDQHPPQTTAAAAVGKGKRAPPAGGLQQQQQQKKGKWKSVSRAMMEKGYHVSPQQCEDKFNDLNKRYKRVKELLGKGTAYRVVEDHALLDSMPHLTPKAKDEARRLLNSKHLFFREMCAYHTAGGGGAATSPSAASPPPPPPPKEQYQCFHHPSDAAAMCRGEAASLVRGAGRRIAEDDENDEAGSEDGDDDEEEGYDDDDGEEEDDNGDEDEGGEDEDIKGLMAPTTTATVTSTSSGAKRPRGGASTKPKSAASPPLSLSLWSPPPSTSMQQLRCELTGLSGRGEQQHQRQWLRRRAAELGEQQMGYRGQALQLERQRFKWLRFSSNKEREMERTKLNNERLRLENERMLLLLHQKELELISNEGGGAASSPAVPPTADRQTTN